MFHSISGVLILLSAVLNYLIIFMYILPVFTEIAILIVNK